jgi:hypothetical protein
MAVRSSEAHLADMLEPDEHIRFTTRVHWIAYDLLIIGCVLFVSVVVFGLLTDPEFARIAILPGVLVFGGILRARQLRATVVVVTDRRLMVVGRSGAYLSGWYGEFDAMTVEWGLPGRLLGSGALALWQFAEPPSPDTARFRRMLRVRKIQTPDDLAVALSDATAAAGRRVGMLDDRAL